MVRTVKKSTRPLKKGEQATLLPGATMAEPWESWLVGGGHAECVRTCQSANENPLRRISTLALPTSQVFALPLWFNQTDPKLIGGAIPLQLELRGFQAKNQGPAIFDYSIVLREETQTLVLIGVLPHAFSAEFQPELYRAFDLSARFLPMPGDSLVLWKERDSFVCAVTRGSELAYFQAFKDDRIGPRLLQDLQSLRLSLDMRGILAPLRQAVVWAEVSPADLEALGKAVGVPAQSTERPLPRLPATPWKLVPPVVTSARHNRETRRWQIRLGVIALLAYLAAVAWLLTGLHLISGKVAELTQWKSQESQPLSLVHDTRAAWTEVRPVVDEKNYPLELLLHVAKSIPSDQLHLTLFELGHGHLLVKGESKDVSTAFQFLDRLKKEPALSGYTWQMGQPHLLPNDLAQFQVEADRSSGDFP